MFNLIKARITHGYQAIPNPLKTGIHPSFPGRPEIESDADLSPLIPLCPTGAISEKGIDLGLCVFCGLCQRTAPETIRFMPDFKIAADSREKLIIAPGQKEMPKITSPMPRLTRRSFAMRNVSAGGCNACEQELGASSNVNFDIGRYGIEVEASPRHTDALILTGPISKNMAYALLETYKSIPKPKFIILCGTCAISGGSFAGSDQIDRSFIESFEVQLYIPGCPAHPLSIVHAIHSFMGAK
ncbi:MAG: NADH:ubiquinone oxidoreductase [Candidatus Cloacimonetes bacterium]|jgi:Ni,Fe-hydrogenase III small subunit|nr:NADH:ubiquinone oxidoreductase [Candidatus Cloacimonadota bacterium]